MTWHWHFQMSFKKTMYTIFKSIQPICIITDLESARKFRETSPPISEDHFCEKCIEFQIIKTPLQIFVNLSKNVDISLDSVPKFRNNYVKFPFPKKKKLKCIESINKFQIMKPSLQIVADCWRMFGINMTTWQPTLCT